MGECCILGVCCPPGSAEQLAAFETALTQHFKGDALKAKRVALEMQRDLVKFTKKLAKTCEACS